LETEAVTHCLVDAYLQAMINATRVPDPTWLSADAAIDPVSKDRGCVRKILVEAKL
jgi:hypothetical protein